MTIIYNTNYTHNPNSYLTIGIQRAAEALFGRENVVVADNRSLAELAAAGSHATLICLDGQRLDRHLIERVRPTFDKMILWLFEDPFMLNYNIKNADLFDVVFTNDPSCVGNYGSKGHYLPLASSLSLQHRPLLADEALEYDIFFAGTMWPNRTATLRALLRHFPEKRFKLVCPTNIYLPPLPRDIASRSIQWPISHESFVDFANASRVTLTMFRNYASHGDISNATAPGPRLFELALCGTAQVVEVDPALPIDNFKIIEGIACCQNLPDLLEQTRAVLASPGLRRERAEKAQQSASLSHLYENRLQQMASLTGAQFGHQATTALHIGRPRKKLRVLMCTHSTIREPEWGGVEVYQEILVTALGHELEVLFWTRRGDLCRLTHSNGTMLEEFTAPERGWLDILTDAIEEKAFSNVVSQYGIDIVHFQHLGHHALSLPIIAKSCGVGTVFSAHDFMLVCSRYNLLDFDQKFCDIGNRNITACDICLRISENTAVGAQATRRGFVSEMLRSVDVLLFGTPYSEDLTLKIYPGLASKRRVVLGIPTRQDASMPQSRPVRDPEAPLKVAIVGNFLRSKGASTLLSIIQTANPSSFEFDIFGRAELEYEDVLNNAKYPNVRYFGRYGIGDLDAIGTCDVALHLSLWPETFCISLSEVWQRGVIPIVTAMGALRDRVQHGENGFVVDVNDAAKVISYLELLRADSMLLTKMRDNITQNLWINTKSYAEAILEIYRSVQPHRDLGVTALSFDSGHVHLLPHNSWRDLAPPRHIFDAERRSEIAFELPEDIESWVNNSSLQAFVEGVSGSVPSEFEFKTGIEFDGSLEVVGWTFVPSIGISGQVFVVLIGDGEGSTIVLKAVRASRTEVSNRLLGAPQRIGFEAKCTLYGKWSDGRYQIAVVNVFNNRAAFSLTPVMVTLREGRVNNVWLKKPQQSDLFLSPAIKLEKFKKLIEPDQFTSNMPFKHARYYETNFRSTQGHIVYGPYILLPIGNFKALFKLKITGTRLSFSRTRITIDIARGGSEIVASKLLQLDELTTFTDDTFTFMFENDSTEWRYEFRIHVKGKPLFNSNLRFEGVDIESIAYSPPPSVLEPESFDALLKSGLAKTLPILDNW